MSSPTVRIRLDFSPDCSVGPGKIALLEGIARTGSLSSAARVLGMSYRRVLSVNYFVRPATTIVTGAMGF